MLGWRAAWGERLGELEARQTRGATSYLGTRMVGAFEHEVGGFGVVGQGVRVMVMARLGRSVNEGCCALLRDVGGARRWARRRDRISWRRSRGRLKGVKAPGTGGMARMRRRRARRRRLACRVINSASEERGERIGGSPSLVGGRARHDGARPMAASARCVRMELHEFVTANLLAWGASARAAAAGASRGIRWLPPHSLVSGDIVLLKKRQQEGKDNVSLAFRELSASAMLILTTRQSKRHSAS